MLKFPRTPFSSGISRVFITVSTDYVIVYIYKCIKLHESILNFKSGLLIRRGDKRFNKITFYKRMRGSANT